MKNYFRYLIILITNLLLFVNVIFAQIQADQIQNDMMKYWFYRNRLNNYFVVPGEKIGESQIIGVRNKINADNAGTNPDKSKSVDYGQHGIYTGLYIGVLATEYYLLNKNGQYTDAAKTESELYMALNAVKVFWDEQAEHYYEGAENSFNGFFIRGNVPCDFFSDKSFKHNC